MIQFIAPVLTTIFSLLKEDDANIAKSAGVSPNVLNKVTHVIEGYLTKDEKMLQLSAELMQQARQHDIETFDKHDKFSNCLRSCVRPIATFVALFWYVYARLHDIPLASEDYAIIGGILAFWFGFRPFEKRK